MNVGNKRTPFEAWHGFPPDASHLRVFDSLAFVFLPTKAIPSSTRQGTGGARSAKRQKLDYRSARDNFVVFAPQQKA
ncbi:putative integrase catalytic domain-containing protein [Phytophthora infestans]|uniref:Putative integrase catalytic domain-containing protein n=1 Tax=Phytophthora infestans TaxID=4787 RepID=A0A8S9TRF9_PHYIN|nr:putative integrase catalytic domain-containing protein [Phytophthora infestans]